MKGLISSHGTLLLKLMKRYLSKGSFLHSLYLLRDPTSISIVYCLTLAVPSSITYI